MACYDLFVLVDNDGIDEPKRVDAISDLPYLAF
jgi:hypothetical protein